MSTNTQAISDEVNAAKMRFDAACRDWGWQADQGYDANAISASNIEYRTASDALSAAIAKAIHDAVMAERDKHAWQPIHTAPKDGTAVDLWGVNHLHYAKSGRRATDVMWGPVRDWMGNERDDWQHGQGEDFEPTHWCSRPAAPKAEG